MTEEQIEDAARELCRVRGLDAAGWDGHPTIPVTTYLSESKAEVRRFIEVGQAIAAVMELPRLRRKGKA